MAESGERRARAFDQPFADAFPEVRDAVVKHEISGRDLGGATTSYGRTTISVLAGNFQGRIPCPHPQCHAGGFEIERIVDQMVKARRRPGKEYSSAPDGSGIATGSRASIASATPSSSSFDPARGPRSPNADGVCSKLLALPSSRGDPFAALRPGSLRVHRPCKGEAVGRASVSRAAGRRGSPPLPLRRRSRPLADPEAGRREIE